MRRRNLNQTFDLNHQ
jgi:hypothetical protein